MPPRYYDRMQKWYSWGDHAAMKLRRGEAVCASVEDNFPHRLDAKRAVARARLERLKRTV